MFLHDTGKLHPGFQAKGWPNSKRRLHGHVSEGLAVFCSHATAEIAAARHALQVDALAGWGVSEDLLRASIGHHGRPFSLRAEAENEWKTATEEDYNPIIAAESLGALLPVWFPRAFAPDAQMLPNTPEFQHLFCGLATLADWIGSNKTVFAYVETLDVNYIDHVARKLAPHAISLIGLAPDCWRQAMAEPSMFDCIAPGKHARPAQAAIGSWPHDDPLVILESETGSGKTEAALWRFAQLFWSGKVDGLYFAVPTRAAAKQLFERIRKAVELLFGAAAPEPVLAIPGYLQAGKATGQMLPDYSVIWDDQPEAGHHTETQLLSRWAAENAKRFLAAPIAVGTIDQAMLAALQVKHAHLRAASLARSLLVIDEAHASDQYMTQILRSLLGAHLDWGGHALLMSATLGSSARSAWLNGRRVPPPSLKDAINTPYPALWSRSVKSAVPVNEDDRRKVVAMEVVSRWDADSAAQIAIAAAEAGARVLMIRNTVTAAVKTFEAIQAAGAEALIWQVAGAAALHHSRYAPEDRILLDRAVEGVLSPNVERRARHGLIVIGTQTLEQSLDICSDLLITDLCPVDVLLQRIGRLHRHSCVRPAEFEAPRCILLTPEQGLDRLVSPTFDNGLGAWKSSSGFSGVYLNLPSCELTRRLAMEYPVWRIPEMNRFLVESATHEESIETLIAANGPAWSVYWDSYLGKAVAEQNAGQNVILNMKKPLVGVDGNPALFASDEQAVRTRLGAEGIRLRFVDGTVGPFGQPISSMTLPAHFSQGLVPPEEPLLPITKTSDRILIDFSDRRFVYDRTGLQKSNR